MSRFFIAEGIAIDLADVSCVAENGAIVGGVFLKLSEVTAYDMRKQFLAYKRECERTRLKINELVFYVCSSLGRASSSIASRFLNRQRVASNESKG